MGIKTIGLDNFNAYYSVEFKRARAAHLKKSTGVEVLEMDLCGQERLAALMAEQRFTHVVHLGQCLSRFLPRFKRLPVAPNGSQWLPEAPIDL